MREIGDRRNEGKVLGNLGIASRALGEPRRAIAYYEQSLAIARDLGDRSSEANTLYNSALALDELGERAQAVRRAGEALTLFEAIGAKDGVEQVRAQLTAWDATDGCS